jgi:hypothetical protein
MTHPVRTWRLAAVAVLTLGAFACSETSTDLVDVDGPITAPLLSEIDLSNTAGGQETVNDAIWTFPVPFNVGTGQINPFLSVQNDPNEEGFNTDGALPLDTKRPNFTNALPLNFVPTIEGPGGVGLFREIILDANESNSEPDALFSIDRFDLWLCNDAGAATYTTRSQFQSNADCALVYDIDDDVGGNDVDYIKATDAVTSGSGLDLDYQILIPEANFIAAAASVGADLSGCAYQGIEADPCGAFLILDVRMGFQGGDLITGATFEETSTIKRPYVTVDKTAETSFTREHLWTITKDHNDADSLIALFDGQNQDVEYTLVIDETVMESDFIVEGTITVDNPSSDDVTVDSIIDEFNGGELPVDCGVSFPYLLEAGETLECTYESADLGSAIDGTNTVSVFAQGLGVNQGTAAVSFASATITEIDPEVKVLDDWSEFVDQNDGDAQDDSGAGDDGMIVVDDDATFTYTVNFECAADEGQQPNTAEIRSTDDNALLDDDDELITVSCGNVTVEKDVTANLEEDFQWMIQKSHSDADSTLNLFTGDDADVKYTLQITKMSAQQVHNVFGDIVITNTADIDKTGVVAIDCVEGSDDGGTTWMALAPCDTINVGTVGANSADTVSYDIEYDPTGKTSFRNRVVIEMGGMVIDDDTQPFTPATEDDDPGNDSVRVWDDWSEFGGPMTIDTDSMFMYTVNFQCDADEGANPNTAWITPLASADTLDSDDELITVVCHDLAVSKTVETEFKRRYDWSIDKMLLTDMLTNYDAMTNTATVSPDQVLTPKFQFELDATSEDYDFSVSGEIKVVNPNPDLPATVDVSDELSDMTGLSVDCGDGDGLAETIAAADSITCSYSGDLGSDFDGTNKATAELENVSVDYLGVATPNGGTQTYMSGNETVDFGDPSMVIDECVDVVDEFSDVTGLGALDETHNLGRFCAEQGDEPDASDVVSLPHLFPEPPLEVVLQLDDTRCGLNEFSNTVVATEIDNLTERDDTEGFFVDVVCEEGCTLTQGYWKTHNPLFWGGASKKADPTWEDLGDVDGDLAVEGAGEEFYGNGFTYFDAMWTAPSGNMYWQLARQFIAATLNSFNASTTPEVDAALAAADVFFSTYSPAAAAGLPDEDPGTPGVIDSREEIVAAAGLLASYNEGDIGPGHCTEDDESAED